MATQIAFAFILGLVFVGGILTGMVIVHRVVRDDRQKVAQTFLTHQQRVEERLDAYVEQATRVADAAVSINHSLIEIAHRYCSR